MSGPLVVVGDALLDRDVEGAATRLAPDAPVPVLDEQASSIRPGGAALAAALVASTGADVILVAAIGRDEPGRNLRALLSEHGVDLVDLGSSGCTPEKIRLRAGRQVLLRLDRASTDGVIGPMTDRARASISSASAILVADYGRGLAGHREVRAALRATSTPMVVDPHPRGAPVIPGAQLVTPNVSELPQRAGARGLRTLTEITARARASWRANGVALTLGADGALYVSGDGPPLVVRTRAIDAQDTCGAGDCFASFCAVALARGAVASEAVQSAVEAATQFVERGAASSVASRSAVSPHDAIGEGRLALAGAEVQRGTLVAAGGCFDVLHAGHITFLQNARRLGDRLVVCLNSDRSVRALKGPGRPFVREERRKGALEALDCVDEVVIFDETTTDRVLRALRPQVFAKGADYARGSLPEQRILDEWSGQCVVLPYVDGYSTTRLLQDARTR